MTGTDTILTVLAVVAVLALAALLLSGWAADTARRARYLANRTLHAHLAVAAEFARPEAETAPLPPVAPCAAVAPDDETACLDAEGHTGPHSGPVDGLTGYWTDGTLPDDDVAYTAQQAIDNVMNRLRSELARAGYELAAANRAVVELGSIRRRLMSDLREAVTDLATMTGRAERFERIAADRATAIGVVQEQRNTAQFAQAAAERDRDGARTRLVQANTKLRQQAETIGLAVHSADVWEERARKHGWTDDDLLPHNESPRPKRCKTPVGENVFRLDPAERCQRPRHHAGDHRYNIVGSGGTISWMG